MVVVTDANILINFLHLDRLALLAEIPGWRFVVPEEVISEVSIPAHRTRLLELIDDGGLGRVLIDSIPALALYAEMIRIMGKGEAACLALAATSDMLLASDEKKRFRRSALAHIGEQRIIGTQDIMLRAIRQGLLTTKQADLFKAVLAANRFVMPFGSFSELI